MDHLWVSAGWVSRGADEIARSLLPGGGGPGATEVDYLTALERWVEAGEAPESLLAYKVKDPVSTFLRQPRFPLPPGSVVDTRKVYPYPPIRR